MTEKERVIVELQGKVDALSSKRKQAANELAGLQADLDRESSARHE